MNGKCEWIMDKEFFIKVCDEVIGQQQGLNGIGTLGEKTVHSVLKSYYSPDNINHEIKVGGFVADICTGNEIIEIQTRNFDKLRRKLTAFLAFAPVTIVYPIHNIKWLRWVNPQTGEISPPRKSPRPGSPYSIFPELYRIKDYLVNPNLRLKIVMINLEEYRFLDGWSKDKKKGSSRCDRIPTEIVNEISINSISDYQVFVPDILSSEFTSKDYKKASGLPLHQAQTALHILHYIGAVDRVGKKGNSFVYAKNTGDNNKSTNKIPVEEETVPTALPVKPSKAKQKSRIIKEETKKYSR
ncbi:MAG TPA: hypothetical protein VN258_08415 [Mobilitalea sp.]|nr:hypothetical protein [Mobilitalea sp.]